MKMYDPQHRVRYSAGRGSYKPRHMNVKEFDVLVDVNPIEGNGPVIGLQVEPVAGATFIIPIAASTAKDMANLILQTLMFAQPEMFFPADVAQKFRNGELSLEQLKELV